MTRTGNSAPSRRGFIGGGLCACAACGLGVGAAQARIRPADVSPRIGLNYAPLDNDERGLWDQIERVEEEVASSNLLVRDEALHRYVDGVLGRVAAGRAAPRLYILRSPDFNAAMFPNGMMILNSGTLLRLRNEAQLAAVLAHETGHYLRQHQLQAWRDIKTRTGIMSFVALGIGLGGIAARVDTRDLVYSINNSIFLGAFAYQRDLEAEADAMSLNLLEDGGYAPEEASGIWLQLIEERDASARARHKRPKRGYSVFATHPTEQARMTDLAASAREVAKGGGERYREVFVQSVLPLRQSLLDDQIKLNDPGASLYILDNLARDGWDGVLRYEQAEAFRLRGEPGDEALAASAVAAAVAMPGAPAEAFRAHGYAQLKAGDGAGGKAALARYLDLQPGAKDAAMVRFTLAQ